MKGYVFLQFLTFLLTSHAASSSYSGSRGYPNQNVDRSTGASAVEKDKDKGYKIVIKLDEAFGRAAEDLELVREMSVDIKLIKVLLEDLIPDIKELRRQSPELFTDNSGSYALRQLSNNTSKLYNSPNASRYQSGIAGVGRGYSGGSWVGSGSPKTNCAELRLSGQKKSGTYTIQPDRSLTPFEVYCDMETDGGGWTVIQRRGVVNVPKAIRENFYRDWEDYENGFGIARSDYWLGLENIHALTNGCSSELIVNITSWDQASKFARYGMFNISGKSDFYRLNIANYTGNAGDGLLQHNKMRFSTYDKKNDMNGDENCAELYRGAWWYKDCFWSNLNGEYADDGTEGRMATRSGIEWSSRHFYSYMRTEMKIRNKC